MKERNAKKEEDWAIGQRTVKKEGEGRAGTGKRKKKEEDWVIRQRTVKKEGERRAGTRKRKEGRGLGYKEKNSEEGRRKNGWKRDRERRKRSGL